MSTFTPSAEQAAIIDAPVDADVLVVAGAGSGKTFTMTQRIIALINRGVAPERILGLTFTRKAAGELLERVSAAVAGDMAGSTTATVSDRAFLKPAIFTYDAFFQTIVRQYGLLVGFDQNTQPLSAAGALQLATEVIDSHMDLAFSEDFGAFSSLANRVLALSDAIGSAMIGAGCTSFDDAINRVRQWDSAFINRLQQAVADEPMPEDEPKIPKIKRLKKDTDASWQAKLDDRAEHLHARCTYHCGALLETTRKRDILLQLVEAYAQAKRERNMAEFSDFTIAAYQLIERFPSIGERTRRRYSHVLLDEYQDTSTTQAALLAALFHVDASQRSAVNALGDPFQSFYAWRGASPGAFRMFQQDFHLQDGHRTAPFRSRTTGTDAGRTESAGRRAVSVQITYARISGGIGTGRIDHIRGRLFRAVGTSGNPRSDGVAARGRRPHRYGIADALAGHATIHHVRSGFDHVGPFC